MKVLQQYRDDIMAWFQGETAQLWPSYMGHLWFVLSLIHAVKQRFTRVCALSSSHGWRVWWPKLCEVPHILLHIHSQNRDISSRRREVLSAKPDPWFLATGVKSARLWKRLSCVTPSLVGVLVEVVLVFQACWPTMMLINVGLEPLLPYRCVSMSLSICLICCQAA